MKDDWTTLKPRLARCLSISAERDRGVSGRLPSGDRLFVDLAAGTSGASWLVVRAPICSAGELDARLVLERNGRLAFAAIMLFDEEYLVRVAVPLTSPEAVELGALLTQVADAARSLRPRVVPSEIDPRTLYAHYTQ